MNTSNTNTHSPHANTPILRAGATSGAATAAIVLLHGRGASAEDILTLGPMLTNAPHIAFVAPQAAGHTWYPLSFMAPREANEPFVTSALAKVDAVVRSLEAEGLARDRIIIAGFSQGACLTSEYLASHPARYAAAIAFTGGLIGALAADLTHTGSLAQTPVLLASGDPDPHVPWTRVEETARELHRMGAIVTAKRYPNRPHTIGADELALAQQLIANTIG